MRGFLVVCESVRAVIAAAADISTNEADPEVELGATDAALRRLIPVGRPLTAPAEIILCISTHRASASFPLL